jgi:hypothetical protein
LAVEWLASAWNYTWEAVRTHPFNFLTLLFALAAIIISVLAWNAACRQTKAAERQAKANEDAVKLQAEALKAQAVNTQRALIVAERSAVAAEGSAVAAERAVRMTQLGLRASLVVTEVAIVDWSVDAFPIRVQTFIRNGGATLAKQVETWQMWSILDEFPESPEYPQPRKPESRGVVGNGADVTIPVVFELDASTKDQVRAGKRQIFLYGYVKYQDVFDEPHETKWCWRYDLNVQRFAAHYAHNSVK